MKRRAFIKSSTVTAFSIAAYGSLHFNGKSFEGNSVTTTDILGPYYRPGSPMRFNLIPPGSTAPVLHLSGTVFAHDGKTPLPNVLIESWQCDEHQNYDNTSDDYLYRGSFRTGKDGKYSFKTIVAVSYKDGTDWRPAHIHLRVSSAGHQDLITQIYFKGDPHIAGDASSGSPQSVNRILEIKKNAANESVVKFDITMGVSLKLDDAAFKKITGLYQLEKGMAEFNKEDDLLILKMNGQWMEGMVYNGNNSFEGGLGFNRVKFEILKNGQVKANIILWDLAPDKQQFLEKYEGVKILKYSD